MYDRIWSCYLQCFIINIQGKKVFLDDEIKDAMKGA